MHPSRHLGVKKNNQTSLTAGLPSKCLTGITDLKKAQQLLMSLHVRGKAQKILGDLSQDERKYYDNLKSILSSIFCPKQLVVTQSRI